MIYIIFNGVMKIPVTVNSMRALDVIEDTETAGKNEEQGEITALLNVRPMSSTRELNAARSDLSVYNAIKFDRPR